MENNEEFDKTEKATPFKLREARKKGQVAKSQEVNHWLMLFTFTMLLAAFWNDFSPALAEAYRKLILGGPGLTFEPSVVLKWFAVTVNEFLTILSPAMFIVIIVAVLANLVQTGPVFSVFPLQPDFKRIHPAQGFKKIFGRRILFELFKTLAKITIFILLVYFGTSLLGVHFYDVILNTPGKLDERAVSIVIAATLTLLICLLPIVILDLLHSRHEFARKMRMSRREIKEEHKRHDGNPEVKSKRREIQKELRNKTASLANVKNSDLIITNPTHFSIALRYDQSTMGVPVVVAKGKGEIALHIRKLAQSYAKPILRMPPLARLLFKRCKIDEPIPMESYRQVAEAYRWLYQLNKESH